MPETILPHPMRGDFISMITHDLRAPLTNLSIFLDLTRSGIYKQSDPLFNDRLGQLIPEVARINRLVDELLRENESSSTTTGLNIGSINSMRLIDASINAVRHCAYERNISIAKDCVNVTVVVDFDRLTRVLVNLLQNAIKFSPRGAEVLVVARIRGKNLEISVIDEGPGIAEHDRVRIFQPYQRGDAHANETGVGLGLSISKAFVRAHGGQIGVKPREGAGGSHFWFFVPLTSVLESFEPPVIASS